MVVTESQQALAVGDPAPPFELPGADGREYTLDDFADHKALLVVFTCNHCPYAKAKIGTMNDLADDYDDVAVVGINSNDAEQYPEDSFEVMVDWVESGRIAYDAYLRDASQEVARAYGAECTPDPFLFGKESGTFRLAYHGRLDDALDPKSEPTVPGGDVRTAIDAVLDGRPVEGEFHPSRGCNIKWTD